ncbi:MAG: CBS domain-containing protein [Polyangiales bacterium]
MTTQVITLNEWDNLGDIRAGMEAFGLRHLPVVDGKRLVGLVSHRDMLRYAVSALEQHRVATERQSRLEEQFVASIMTREVRTVTPETSVQEAAQLFTDYKIGCLPVVDGQGDLQGLVTEHDLLQLLVEDA